MNWLLMTTGLAFSLILGPAQAETDCPKGESVYQIVKSTEDTAWRLNTRTGEIVACRFDGQAMVCGSTETAVVRPQGSYEDLKQEKKQDRADKMAEEMAMFDRFLAMAKSLLAMVMEFEEKRSGGSGEQN